eukprot:UN14219
MIEISQIKFNYDIITFSSESHSKISICFCSS